MSPTETLSKSKPCRRCGRELPFGTLLPALEWDRRERTWAHRSASCNEVRAAASPEALAAPLVRSGHASAALFPKPTRVPGPASSPEDSTRGPWNVTGEIHDAADPSHSKLVLRVPRPHIRKWEEALAEAAQLG